MSSRKNVTRKPATLTPKTEKVIFNYSVVAGAAGVSLLALAQPSEAKIVYTPTHQVLSLGSLSLDLNGDGISDFVLQNSSFAAKTGSFHSGEVLTVAGELSVNQVLGPIPGYAAALFVGFRVGTAGNHFNSNRPQDMVNCLRTSFGTVVSGGSWRNVTGKYLGLKFLINGQTHYGWARLNVKRSGCKITALLTGYAYETVANKPILTGKTSGPVEAADLARSSDAPTPPALGLLAQGADGLAIWRKEEEPIARN